MQPRVPRRKRLLAKRSVIVRESHIDEESGESSRSPRQAMSSSPSTRPKQINLSRQRLREELDELRVTASNLQKQLTSMKARRALKLANASPWQHLAMQMRAEKEQALELNEFYRTRLHAQIAYSQALQAALANQPNSGPPSTQEPTNYSLYLPLENRAEAAKDISKHQYQRLTSALVASNLIDCSESFSRIEPKTWPGDLIGVEAVVCEYSTIDFRVVAQTTWDVITGAIPDATRPIRILEMFSELLIYTSETSTFMDMAIECRDVIERFKQPNREVIIFRYLSSPLVLTTVAS
ncbi:hypothetical protein AC1031_020045 [Aphanomyces cochlioides]|nr:hypothetical protein AC1031_020045 [Aphanomyces cochlioides]